VTARGVSNLLTLRRSATTPTTASPCERERRGSSLVVKAVR
jgi:hypothetical protein